MKKETGKLLITVTFSVLFLVLMMSFASAATFAEDAVEFVKSFITTIFGGTALNDSMGFAQFLFFVLVFLIVYSVSEFIPVIKKGWVSIIFSVAVAILATLYLKSEEIYSILLSYEAFGIALTSIIPFILVAVITKKLHDQGHGMIGKALWILLAVVIIIKVVAGWEQITLFGGVMYGATILLVLLMIKFEGKIYFFISKAEIKEYVQGEMKEEAIAKLTAEAEQLASLAAETSNIPARRAIVRKHNAKAEMLRSYGVSLTDLPINY